MQHLCYHPCGFPTISSRMYDSMSNPGEVLRFVSNWTTCSTGCVPPRQFLWVSTLRPYSPGGLLNGLPSLHLPPKGKMRLASIRLGLGLRRSLICFAPLAFVSQCQSAFRNSPSPLVFPRVSTHFTTPPWVPVSLKQTLSFQYPALSYGWATVFKTRLKKTPTLLFTPSKTG